MTAIDAIYGLGISHNKFPLVLPDGTYYPDYLFFVDKRPIEFLTHFDRVRDRDWSDCTFADLGCSEGSTTFGISQTGATVYGVEGRADGVERAKVLRDIVGFERTHFQVGNVYHEESYREVDGIFNAGVLYHLEDPVACLERSARNARHFVYLDTGHAPRSAEERAASKFSRNFGRTYTFRAHGVDLEAVDFAEPGHKEEKKDGIRRGPRAGIGNTNSVWLSQASTIELMKALGFPYHETIADKPHIPRLRTCFWRTEPRPATKLGPLPKALPKGLPRDAAIAAARARDLAYLKRTDKPVTVVGHKPLLAAVASDLKEAGVRVDAVLEAPGALGDPLGLMMLDKLLARRSGLVAVATRDVARASFNLMKLDRFPYVFTSFALTHDRELAGA